MQASKSREDARRFDVFRCLACDTSIVEADADRPPPPRRKPG